MQKVDCFLPCKFAVAGTSRNHAFVTSLVAEWRLFPLFLVGRFQPVFSFGARSKSLAADFGSFRSACPLKKSGTLEGFFIVSRQSMLVPPLALDSKSEVCPTAFSAGVVVFPGSLSLAARSAALFLFYFRQVLLGMPTLLCKKLSFLIVLAAPSWNA